MNNIFFKTLFKKGAKGAKGEKGTSYEVPTNGIIGFDDEDGELDIPAGYDDATIPPYLIEKIIRANGVYNAESEGAFGYSKVNVNIDDTPTLISKTITENGTYDPADDNADGYSSVIVDVEGGTVKNPNYAWFTNQDETLIVRLNLNDNTFRWYFNNYELVGFDTVPANLQRFILNDVGAAASIGGAPNVVGFYDDTIRGWTPTLSYNVTGIVKGIVESTDTSIDYDNIHAWVDPTFDPING